MASNSSSLSTGGPALPPTGATVTTTATATTATQTETASTTTATQTAPDVSELEELHVFAGHTDAVNDVAAISRGDDSLFVLTASSDKSVGVWLVEEKGQKQLKSYDEHKERVNAVVALCRGGAKGKGPLAISASADNTIQFWDIPTGSTLRTVPTTSTVCSLVLSQNGTLLAAGFVNGHVSLYSSDSGSCVHSFGPRHGYGGTYLAAQGDLLVSAGPDRSVVLYSLSKRTELHTWYDVHEEGVRAVCFAGQDRVVVGCDEEVCIVLDTSTHEELDVVDTTFSVHCLRAVRQGNLFLVGLGNGGVKSFPVSPSTQGGHSQNNVHTGAVLALKAVVYDQGGSSSGSSSSSGNRSSAGDLLVSGSKDHTAKLWRFY